LSQAGELATAAVPSGEETFCVATIPLALERAAESGRGLTLIDRNLDATPLPYALLERGARRAGARLAREGVAPGDRVCVVSSTSAEMLVSLFGVWRAGAVPVILPLPARASEAETAAEELRRRAEHVDARAVVTSDAMAGLVAASGVSAATLTCRELAGERDELGEPAVTEPDDLAYLQFTSGTTGRSRAVALTHRQMLCNTAGLWSAYPIPAEESLHASWLPLFHDMGLLSLLTSVALTGRLIVQPPEEFLRKPRSWVEGISRFRATTTAAPNFSYALATLGLRTGTANADLASLRIAGNGAEPIEVETLDEFTAAAMPYGFREEAMSPMYGLAEATLAVCVSPADRPLAREVVDREQLETAGVAREADPGAAGVRVLAACGQPIPGCEVRICDEDGRELGAREVGEICVRSPSVMSGYWNDPEATAEALRDGWLRTGDLGYMGANGLVVCGRIKDMIIVGGRNLYPEDYEHVAQQVPGTRPASVAFALTDSERMVVAIEPSSHSRDHDELAALVMQSLRERLAHAPDRVLIVQRQSIPRTSSGKTRRQAARQKLDANELPVLATAKR
jgi:fatty-acyl-CoA synthase